MRCRRTFVTLAAALGLAAAARAQDRGEYEAKVRPFLAAHCFDCHGEDVQKRNLRLDTLAPGFADAKAFPVWERVYEKLRAGEMPPPKRARPARAERDAVLAWLRDGLVAASLARRTSDERPRGRRLTRVEYEHTVRDLLALPRLELKEMLPDDGEAHGFDKVGEALQISHVQMARYLEAAETSLRAAVVNASNPPEAIRERLMMHDQYVAGHGVRYGVCIPMSGLKFDPTFNAAKRRPREKRDAPPKCTALGVIRGAVPGADLFFSPRRILRDAGVYRLRVRVWSFFWDRGKVLPSGEPLPVKWFAGARPIGYVDAPSLKPTEHELVAYLEPGERIGFDPASIPLKPPVTNPGRRDKYRGPGVAVEWLELEGPLHEAWPPESHRRLFDDLPLRPEEGDAKGRKRKKKRSPPTCRVHSAAPLRDAERLLRDFMERAFRRPAPSGEVERYLALVGARLQKGAPFEEALLTGYKAVLCSPDFLFLGAPTDDYALASRLSYFLWSSMPDETLLRLAAGRELRKPKVLRAQVDRLIDDPRSRRFVEDFSDQWLNLSEIDFTMPDPDLYPEYSPWLRDSMIEETRAFLGEMLCNDLSVLSAVDSDWTMLNAVLAKHYGVEGVQGAALRKVPLPAGIPRGGILTHASVLKVTANGTVTSPVPRGIWVLRNLLGRPPDPPPPDLPAIEPDTRGTTTIREQLDKHRNVPRCATCHVKIDPPGFALESFDVMGGWRKRYRSLGEGDLVDGRGFNGRRVKYRLARPVDSSGRLPDGRTFKGIEEFKRHLLEDPDPIARCVAEKLLTYATGEPPDFAARAEIDGIVGRVRGKGYGLRALVHEIVQSSAFRGE